MPDERDYNIDLDVAIGSSRLIDVPAIVAAATERWSNVSLSEVNDCVVRLGIIEGEFHWHHHDDEDELFFVLEGELLLDLEEETRRLGPHQGWTVPRGVRHRTRAPSRTVMLMVEGAGVRPTGD